jgi:hypothetical protein
MNVVLTHFDHLQVKIAPPKVIANESHRKVNTKHIISLNHDKIK